ncbi:MULTISPECIES: hypothetical protein [Bizionia]|uniref:RiboL-PSP-HEPN domain-containing protein n=1 Tax=Bizionia algoritergicola TaxID=291187 RepID=A0A5D0QS28_9FLAO|nr:MULTISPECIES: hypothetical protein [Bizionia]OBX22022.1 hypothetical protein BAA08_10100 [Bizionia sp. APA-3]TYB71980.1 hypothetical protein ES675_12495 [Bizionia algoritergicola]
MREELKNTNWHIYGLSITDYDYTKRLINEIIKDRNKQIEIKAKELEIQKIDSEAIADLNYYAYVDNLFIWHFGIWRLQGIFEGILKQEFFPNKNMHGLKSKLDYTRKVSRKIKPEDYNELLEWGKIRNALSHFPPEQYRPSLIQESDFNEYLELLKRVTSVLIPT